MHGKTKPPNSTKVISKKRFTPTEDEIIKSLARTDCENDWSFIAKSLERRTARQCRDRWNNYLNPYLNNKEWLQDEDELLLKLYKQKGPQWKSFSMIFNGRSINNVRNRCFKLVRKSQKKHSKSSVKKKDISKKKSTESSIDKKKFKKNVFDSELFSNFDSLSINVEAFIDEFEESLQK